VVTTTRGAGSTGRIGERFLEHLPRFRSYARFALQHVRCPDTRADLVAEAVALGWRHFVALTRKGRHPERFVGTLALRCAQAVRAGRRLCGSEPARDVLSPAAMARHRVRVDRLDRTPRPGDPVIEALAGNTRSRVPDQAAFRLDFPRWRRTFGRRDRRVLDALMAGGRTAEVAAAFRVTAGRVSQMRRMFRESWAAFHGE
jgi:hypothetical protein